MDDIEIFTNNVNDESSINNKTRHDITDEDISYFNRMNRTYIQDQSTIPSQT